MGNGIIHIRVGTDAVTFDIGFVGVERINDMALNISLGGEVEAMMNQMRAVGTTCTNNPFFMIIPCHRVVHSGKTLEEKLAKGSSRKRAWIEWEMKLAAVNPNRSKARV